VINSPPTGHLEMPTGKSSKMSFGNFEEAAGSASKHNSSVSFTAIKASTKLLRNRKKKKSGFIEQPRDFPDDYEGVPI
jgi:hypothetical protein